MKPNVKKALEVLTQATGMLQLNRQDHVNIQLSLQMIERELNANAPAEAPAQETPKTEETPAAEAPAAA